MKAVTPKEVLHLIHIDGGVLVDIRGASSWSQGVPENAVLMLADEIEAKQKQLLSHYQHVFLLCFKGLSSKKLAEQLNRGDSGRFISIEGGFASWQEQALPLEYPKTDELYLRYDRQMKLPGFGLAAQTRLQQAHVLMVGAGGLGSSALLYLAASGVGRLTLVDEDVVELSNLHRQVIHGQNMLGRKKVDSAQQTIQQINTEVQVHTVPKKLTADNAFGLIEQVDVVIDGTDNLEAKYLLNDVCYALNKPLILAAVDQFEAQLSVFDFSQNDRGQGGSACYRCIFPEEQAEQPMTCSERGVLGVTPGLCGVFQAAECIKLLTGIGKSLNGRMLLFNLLNQEHKMIKYRLNPSCTHGKGITR